jgi:hypothetical protein
MAWRPLSAKVLAKHRRLGATWTQKAKSTQSRTPHSASNIMPRVRFVSQGEKSQKPHRIGSTDKHLHSPKVLEKRPLAEAKGRGGYADSG